MKAMSPTAMAETFNDRFPFVGPAFWMFSVQYLITQVVVARAWTVPFSYFHNTISDLGNTECGLYLGRQVCSPLHSVINASFITLGVTMILGSLLIYQEFRKSMASAAGFTAMAVAGVGSIMVGLFPENVNTLGHVTGAFLPFLIGNLGIIILGFGLEVPRWLKLYSIFSGLIALLAFAFFTGNIYLGLGIGGLERIVAYPQTFWLIVFGIYISSSHVQAQPADLSKKK